MDGEAFRREGMRIGGKIVGADRIGDRCISVTNPYSGLQIGSVPKASIEEVREAFSKAAAYRSRLTRFTGPIFWTKPPPSFEAVRSTLPRSLLPNPACA